MTQRQSRTAAAAATAVLVLAAGWVILRSRSCGERREPPQSQPASCASTHPASAPATRPKDELARLLERIDAGLYRHSCEDLHAWLDQRVRQQVGGVLPDAQHVAYRGDAAYVRMTHGTVADMAAQVARGYELLGDRRYLDAAVRTCEFLLKAQQPRGHWLTAYVATRSGGVGPRAGRRLCRIRDGHQFRPFALLLYVHRLTGRGKYLDAARRCADCLLALQNPRTGSWPADVRFEQAATRPANDGTDDKRQAAPRLGGSYEGFATTDGMRMMLMMYHATGERKYLAHLRRLGRWLIDTNIGRGRVCGWAVEYDEQNRPVAIGENGTAVIDPVVFAHCVGPMLGWFYGLTGDERYAALLRRAHAWLRSVERRDGWADAYLPDGTEVFRHEGKVWRYDDPKAPKDAPSAIHSRHRFRLDDLGKVLEIISAGGRKGLLRWHCGEKVLPPQAYRRVRLAAARRATDPDRLARVRKRRLRQDAPDLPKQDPLGRGGVDRQAWHSIHTWVEPYRPPAGHAQWQFIYDVRLARGELSADAAAIGGRGLEAMHLYEPYDVMGNWTQRAIEVKSWLDVPLPP